MYRWTGQADTLEGPKDWIIASVETVMVKMFKCVYAEISYFLRYAKPQKERFIETKVLSLCHLSD
jgi:hypothetical protein